MEILKISKGGQISLPARIRKRWGVHRLIVDDRGDEVVLIPVPDDPLRAVRGAFSAPDHTVEEDRRRMREEDAEIAARKRRLHG